MSAKGITDELVRQVANDLCTRYGLDDEGMRAGLAARGLHRRAQAPRTSSSRNALPEEHRETFDRLAKQGGPKMPPRWQPSLEDYIESRHTCSAPTGQPSLRFHDCRSPLSIDAISGVPDKLLSAKGREFLAALELPDAARERIAVSLAMIEALDCQLAPIEQQLRQLARRQPGCRALMGHYGIGELTAPTILCELGEVSRLSGSRKAVRCAGLDIGVHRSDRRSRAGKLTRQGSPQLRWALYESAQAACRPTSPDRADYLELKQRGLSHTRASLTISRKRARRCFHTLRELGPDALEPVT